MATYEVFIESEVINRYQVEVTASSKEEAEAKALELVQSEKVEAYRSDYDFWVTEADEEEED